MGGGHGVVGHTVNEEVMPENFNVLKDNSGLFKRSLISAVLAIGSISNTVCNTL